MRLKRKVRFPAKVTGPQAPKLGRLNRIGARLIAVTYSWRHAGEMGKVDRLWARYWAIRDNHQIGHRMPILWHLALAGDTSAMVELGSELSKVGRISERYSQSGLAYAGYRRGDPLGAQHLAMNAFNRNDLHGYRHWLSKAARLGDRDAGEELRRFEIRLPHAAAASIRRRRPQRRSKIL